MNIYGLTPATWKIEEGLNLEDDAGLVEVVQVRCEACVDVRDDKGHSLVLKENDQLLQNLEDAKSSTLCKNTLSNQNLKLLRI